MGFETGSDNEKITELENRIDDIIDSQLTSVGGNESLSIDSTLGQRNDASGDAGGVRSSQPIIHNITENDESGTPTGVFDKINLISSMIIVDHTSTPIDLRFIQGPAKDGSKIKITVKKDKVLVIKSGGNILTTSDITISDNEFFILVKHSAAETGITGGAYKILKVGTVGGAGYDTIQEEGVSLTQRSIMNFIGATVTAVDNPGNSRTDITIVAGTAGLLSDLTINVTKDWAGEGITNLGQLSMVGDIDLATQDIINIDRSEYVVDSGAVAAATDSVILLNSSNQFQFNTAQVNDIIFSLENIAAVAIDHDGTALTRSLSVLSDSTNTNSTAQLNITRNFATSVTGQTIGQLGFLAPSDAGGGLFEYAAIVGEIENATAGSIDGGLRFDLTVNNAVTTFMTMNDGSSDEITVFKQFNFNSNDALKVDRLQFIQNTGSAISVSDATIYVDGIGNGDLVINNVDTEAIIFTHSNVIGLQDTNSTLRKSRVNGLPIFQIVREGTVPVAGTSIADIQGLFPRTGFVETLSSIISFTAEDVSNALFEGGIAFQVNQQSGQNIFMRFNSLKNNQIDMFRTLDINTNFMQLTEIATPANPVVNDGRFYVRDDGGVTTPFFLDSAGTETSMIASAGVSNQIIQGNTSIIITDPGATGVINLVVDGVAVGNITDDLGWILDNTDLTISSASGKLNFQNGFIIENTNSTTTTFDILNGQILLIKEGGDTRIQIDKNITLDADANDDIIFREGGANVGRFDGVLDDWVFERDILLDGGIRIRSFDSTKIGFFVTNSTDNIGSAGTNQTPTEPSISTSVANLEAAFGTAIGSWGVFNTASAFVNIAYKTLSNEWIILAIPDGGGNVISDHIT